MRLRLLTGDPLFRTAGIGLAGALGHSIADDDSSGAAVTLCDAGTIDFEALAQRLDPLRTVVFVPSSPALIPPQSVLSGFIHVAPRTSLAAELPRLLALLAE
jgi:hypothetical protein